MSKKELGLETKLVRGGTDRSSFGETSEAIYLNSGFCYDSAETAESRFNGENPGFVYSRYTNPNLKMLEDRLVMLESGATTAVVCASGMSAVFSSIMCDIKPGDHLVSTEVLFGSCHYIVNTILPRLGVEVTIVNGADKKAWEGAFKENTTHVFIETPANPTLDLIDIEFVGKLAKKAGARFIVDNIFAGPLLQKPFEMGADLVVYSTTKHMDGGGRTLGGAILSNDPEFITDVLLPFHRHTGPALSPFNAWVILKALETYDMRIERHCANAAKIAKFLETQSNVSKVLYPGLDSHPHRDIAKKQMANGGPMVAFEVKGGKEGAFGFMNKLEIIDISNNLGDSKTLLTHPASTTHSNIDIDRKNEIGITQGMLRLSVGLENADDLIADLEAALG